MEKEITLHDFDIYILYWKDMNDLNFDTMTMERYIRLFNAGKFEKDAITLLNKFIANGKSNVTLLYSSSFIKNLASS